MPRKSKPPLVQAEPETVQHGSLQFHDLVETEPDNLDDVPFHRLDLTAGETAVLHDILAYLKGRFEFATVVGSATAEVDFKSLCIKCDPRGVGI